MGVTFHLPSKPTSPPKKGSFQWSEWYQKNKKTLLEKRAHRYKTDAKYREAIKKRSRLQRQAKPATVPTDGYTVPFAEMAKRLGVSVWMLRQWRHKNYYPEPRIREGRLWFTPEQEDLLQKLKDYTGRVAKPRQEAHQQVVELIYANW